MALKWGKKKKIAFYLRCVSGRANSLTTIYRSALVSEYKFDKFRRMILRLNMLFLYNFIFVAIVCWHKKSLKKEAQKVASCFGFYSASCFSYFFFSCYFASRRLRLLTICSIKPIETNSFNNLEWHKKNVMQVFVCSLLASKSFVVQHEKKKNAK